MATGERRQNLPSCGTNLFKAVEEALGRFASQPPPRQLWIVSDGDCGDGSALERSLSTADVQVTIIEEAGGSADTALAQLSNKIGACYVTL